MEYSQCFPDWDTVASNQLHHLALLTCTNLLGSTLGQNRIVMEVRCLDGDGDGDSAYLMNQV